MSIPFSDSTEQTLQRLKTTTYRATRDERESNGSTAQVLTTSTTPVPEQQLAMQSEHAPNVESASSADNTMTSSGSANVTKKEV